jgi:prepilin-type N-terminal cleavage/methylation domain-containing protein
MKFKRGKAFTLIEILVSLAVFGLVMAAAGGGLCRIYNDWRRQRDDMRYIEDARWALEFMSREMRHGNPTNINIGPGPQEWRITYDLSATTERSYRYWYGGKGDIRICNLGWGGSPWNPLLAEGCIVRNPGGGLGRNAFTQEDPSGDPGLITIEISVGDKKPDRRRFHFRTKVRMKNNP